MIHEDKACSACLGSLIHALQRLSERGALPRLDGKICVGQGFVDESGPGIGVGVCTEGLEYSCPGCPPTARDIVVFLENEKT